MNLEIFDVSIFNLSSFIKLLIRFGINILFTTILISKIYFKMNRNRKFLFTFYVFNVLIFFISSLLSDVKLETGFAFGLFALFSIIRYRTRQIPIKEMTFLFASILMATINSTVTLPLSYAEIILANIAILIVSYMLERSWLANNREYQNITYEKIGLIKPNKRKELIADLEKRTGLKIKKIKIMSINFKNDTAKIRVYYQQSNP